MTNAELIAELSKLPPDQTIRIQSDYYIENVGGIWIEDDGDSEHPYILIAGVNY